VACFREKLVIRKSSIANRIEDSGYLMLDIAMIVVLVINRPGISVGEHWEAS